MTEEWIECPECCGVGYFVVPDCCGMVHEIGYCKGDCAVPRQDPCGMCGGQGGMSLTTPSHLPVSNEAPLNGNVGKED